jgi:late competence protein required for DNA uptake (superfamily II DNA/RNA helicase)
MLANATIAVVSSSARNFVRAKAFFDLILISTVHAFPIDPDIMMGG